MSSRKRNASMFSALPLLSAFVGIGWHFSSVLLRPDRTVNYPDQLLTVRDGQAWFVRSPCAQQPGEWGLRWPGGFARVGPPVTPRPDLAGLLGDPVCRSWMDGPIPAGGTRVMFDAALHHLDPGAHGLRFDTVAVRAPLGECPAWWVPAGPGTGPVGTAAAGTGEPDTWVIAVHGRGADRRECLRVLPELHRLGLPVLAISYRNDIDAPPSPDGYYHLGDTEWRDLEAAVEYARGAGARRVVLFGWSMGAAIIGAYLDRAERGAETVVAVVWDCPMLDWRATLRQQASLRRLPQGLSGLALAATRRRIGIDFNRFDLTRRPPRVRPPTLLFHGVEDSAVPIGPARALAAAAARLAWPLRYVEIPGAEHTATWNVDPDSYRRELADFLAAHALAR